VFEVAGAVEEANCWNCRYFRHRRTAQRTR